MKKIFTLLLLSILIVSCGSSRKVTTRKTPCGQGTHTYSDGRKYVGAWKDDLPNGQGTWTHPDGSKYVGEWKKGLWHGQATFTYPDGKVVKGIFRNGELIEQQ